MSVVEDSCWVYRPRIIATSDRSDKFKLFTFCVTRVGWILQNSNESRSRCGLSSGCNTLSPGVPEKRPKLVIIHVTWMIPVPRHHHFSYSYAVTSTKQAQNACLKCPPVSVILKSAVILFGSKVTAESLSTSTGETIYGLRENMTRAIGCLQEADSSVAVSSGGELFLRFITLTSLEHPVSTSSPTYKHTRVPPPQTHSLAHIVLSSRIGIKK